MRSSQFLNVKNTVRAAALVAAVAIAAASPSRAGDEKAKPREMSPEEKAAMEVYMKAATPGPVHEEMARMAGAWNLDITSWPAPGAPAQKSGGTATYETILGGRYLRQTVHSEWEGQPFDGIGTEGYDNVLQERFGTWIDSMGTGIMVTRGKCPAGAKTCTFTGTMSDPMTGKECPVREVVTMTDANKFSFAMYGPDPKGNEFKMMEIVYTRK